jgi:hypothetical protein
MTICLEKAQIDTAVPRLNTGLNQYLWIQTNRHTTDIRSNLLFRRRFNHFYRVRRGLEWQDHFFDLLESKKTKQTQFFEVLDALHKATNRYEASFASKLLATIDPSMPVIDSIVLRNLNLKLPPSHQRPPSTHMPDSLPVFTGCYKRATFRAASPLQRLVRDFSRQAGMRQA